MKSQGSRLVRAPKLIQYCVGALLCILLVMLRPSSVQGLPDSIPNVANLSESTQPLEEPERGVYVVGTTAYLADKERGLRIFDVSDPLHPVQLNQQLIAGGVQEVHVVGRYAYVVDGAGMHIIDVSDPRNPIAVPNGVYWPDRAWDVYVEGEIAYVATWDNDVHLVNISNPQNPSYVNRLPVTNRGLGIEVRGKLAYAIDSKGKGLRIYDVSNPAAVSALRFVVISGIHEKVYVDGNKAYLASNRGGIHIIDVSNPGLAERIGGYPTPGNARDIYVKDDIAYVADEDHHIHVVDVADPTKPTLIRSYDTPGSIQGIFGANGFIYASDSVVGLFVIPEEYGPRPLPGHSGNVGPPGSTDPADLCCMAGYVYWNGMPVYTPTVTVRDKYGNSAAAISHDATYPHYFSLDFTNRTDLNIQIGDTITLIAQGANTPVQTIPYVVKGGPQQVDIVITASSTYTRPIATVNRRSHVNKADVNDLLIFEGGGQDSDATPAIAAYEWRSNKVAATLSVSSTLQIEPYQLTEGRHNLTFRVQDTEGQWSQPVAFALDLMKSIDGWTILLYLAGDYDDNNDLGWQFGNVKANFDQIKSKLPPGVNVVLLKDDRQHGSELAVYSSSPITTTATAERLCPNLQGEMQMDNPETLTNFLSCGQRLFSGTHYYLSIADHGHGILGTAWDYSSPPITVTVDGQSYPNYLETKEIDDAIRKSTRGKVDILHLDSCSMNLLETAHEAHDVADYLISSQFLTWADFSYYNYIRDLDGEESPQEYAFTVANRYVQSVPRSLPYTISVLKLDNYPKVHGALDELATELLRQIENGSLAAPTLDAIRRNVQVLESEYTDEKYGHEPDLDFYVDLAHWATLVRSTVTIPSVQQKADLLLATLARTNGFTIKNAVRSGVMPGSLGGAEIDLSNAQGVSIFYPLQDRRKLLASYVNHRLFTFTEKSLWDEFLKKLNPGIGSPGSGTPLLTPFAPLAAPHQLFLPLVNR